MGTDENRSFSPDYAVPPGATLHEMLGELGLSQADLAERTGRPKKTINEIVKGKAAVTPETALQFERVLGIPAAFWNSLEHQYRAALARAEERKQLASWTSWLHTLPVAQLVEHGWIRHCADKIDQLKEVLTFFGVASPDAWDVVWCGVKDATAFRASKAHASDFGALAAWLRQGELEGRRIDCAPYNASLFRTALAEVRSLTPADAAVFAPAMRQTCAAAGVALVFIPELPKVRACGAARWLATDKALIQLSLYYKRDDQFWFSFFHEAAHVLLHSKRNVFVDTGRKSTDHEEEGANRFAADYLIPRSQYNEFVQAAEFGSVDIQRFALHLGIAPSIIVGRLQHDSLIGYNERNELRRRMHWVQTSNAGAA